MVNCNYSFLLLCDKVVLIVSLILDSLETVDIIENNGKLVFRTCEQEKSKLIFQIGTNDPERALMAARMM